MKHLHRILALAIAILLLGSCATYQAQFKNPSKALPSNDKELAHSFYLIGDAGNSELGEQSLALNAFQEALESAPDQSTAVFLGDNVYEKGIPKKSSAEKQRANNDTFHEYKNTSSFIIKKRIRKKTRVKKKWYRIFINITSNTMV